MSSTVSRRGFLALSAACGAAALLPSPSRAGRRRLRTLGRTGLKVSEVGMGAMITKDPSIVRGALDAGVNYFDTARSYMGGRNEAILAEGLSGRRQEAIIATKCHQLGSMKGVMGSVEESLKALKTDVIDIVQLHGISTRRQVLLQEHLEALAALKKQGKIRFAGVTTHSSMVEVMEAAVEAKVYDTVLTVFNFQSPPILSKTIEKTAAAGVGVIAMKVMTGGYTMPPMPGMNPYQSALRWVLQHKGLSTAVPSMPTINQMEENVSVMGTTTSWRDDVALKMYAAGTSDRYCRSCGHCAGLCPRGVDVPQALRALMYAEGYGRPDLGRQTLSGTILPCRDCPGCSVECPYAIPVGQRMAAVVSLVRSSSA